MAQLADAYGSGSAATVFLSPPSDFKQVKFHIFIFAGVAELADALASGASVRKDVWVQVPPSALKKLDFSGFFLLSTCQQPMSHMTRVTQGTLARVPENVLKAA